jgi:hypothetical protein
MFLTVLSKFVFIRLWSTVYLILTTALDPEVCSAGNIKKKKIIIIIMVLGSKVRLVRRADNLTAIYEPIV